MSSSDEANKALNLVTETIRRLITRFDKLQVGDPAARTLTHDIAVTLHSPNTGERQQLSRQYCCQSSSLPEDTRLLTDKPFGNASHPSNITAERGDTSSQEVQSCRTGQQTQGPGTRDRLIPPKDTQLPVTKPPHEASRAPPREKSRPRKRVNQKNEVSEDKVIYVKQKSQREQAVQPASGPLTAVTPTVAPPAHQPPNQCERCIRDDIACIIPLTKRVGDIRRSCRNCEERKTKCVRLTIDDADLLWGHMALKKAKAATAANRKTKAASKRSACATRATLCARVPSPIKEVAPTTDDSADEDADGEDEPEPAPTASASEVAGPDASNKELGDGSQEPGDPGHVDNDVDMEISTKNTLPAPLPIPTSLKKTNSTALQQPSLLDILWTIEALGKKFEGMALHQEMDGRVTALEEEWNQRFATMEAKIREVEMKNHGNAVSIGHMANSFKMFSHTGKLGRFNHSAGPSGRSHLFGQLPATWMSGTMDAGIMIRYTMALDLSQGPQPSSSLTPSGSPVLRSGEPVQLPSSQPTGSFPPANPFASK
ncbi:hypothetical protein C8R48DRAFT_679340 [Suillus tomentosus]|nr:hypothetical protein C8R48DRAFT_679340 [Suillus tomentosus]